MVDQPEAGKTYEDLRTFISAVDEIGELRQISGIDAHLELAALTEAAAEELTDPPMMLFDDIKGYPTGYRVLSLPLASIKRSALALGLPLEKEKMELLRLAARRFSDAKPLPPTERQDAPVLENSATGDDVDIEPFPAPFFHSKDGGRFIGTGDMIIMRDPEMGYVNAGTYRVQIHDKSTLGLWMSPGQHGRQICDKYWARGESCPVAATFGGDLIAMMASHTKLPPGVSEIEYAGGLHGKPLDVVTGPVTGLPIPAYSEIAIEGEIPPPDVEARAEGPFGEWPGYYSGGTIGTGEDQPVINIKALYYRNDPIIVNMAPMWTGAPLHGIRPEAGLLWDQLEKMGIEGIVGVWHYYHYLIVISLRQRYAGHAKRAGLGALACSATARNGRYVVVVDDDIDPSNIQEVLWAMETRVDPATDIEIVDGCWGTPLDPRMPPSKRMSRNFTNSRAIFYAVRPFEWRDGFPVVSRATKDLKTEMIAKYGELVGFPGLG